MKHFAPVAIPSILCGCLLTACGGGGGSKPIALIGATQPVHIIEHTQAEDSGLGDPAVELIQSEQELRLLGSVTLAEKDVDFTGHSMVVLALGERSTGGWSAKITGIQQKGADLFVQGIAYQPAEGSNLAQVLSYPVAVAIIPKTTASTIHPEIDDVIESDE